MSAALPSPAHQLTIPDGAGIATAAFAVTVTVFVSLKAGVPLSVAVNTTGKLPVCPAAGLHEKTPLANVAPDGTPVADIVTTCPASGSVALTLKLNGRPSVTACGPGTVRTGGLFTAGVLITPAMLAL